jgi:hypothetical protein
MRWKTTTLVLAILLTPAAAESQHADATAPKVLHACYVPLTGTVYRIKESDGRQSCSAASHVEFSWTDGVSALRGGDAAGGDLDGHLPHPKVVQLQGRDVLNALPVTGQVLAWNGSAWAPAVAAGGVSAHNELSGLTADDHPQYLLAEGVRHSTDGFAVRSFFVNDPLPVYGPGTRLIWHARMRAFRAGRVTGNQWDDLEVSPGSAAFGFNARSNNNGPAIGSGATATGRSAVVIGSSTASGHHSVILGHFSQVSGDGSVGIGRNVVVTGSESTAIGSWVGAGSHSSTAIGTLVSTGDKIGSFILGTVPWIDQANSSRRDQFAVRALHFWLGRISTTWYIGNHLITTSTGAYLTTGGAWTNSSDVNRKHLFAAVDGDEVLRKLATVPIRTWSYRDEDAEVRHMGPTAQDFRAAFGLGDSETAISTVDADGVALAAIQALERHSHAQTAEIERLHAENAALVQLLERLETQGAGNRR